MHPNVARLRSAYEAFGRGDLNGVAEHWDDDVLWHITGSTPIAHDRRGREEITEFLGELMILTNGTFRLEPLRYFADDDWGVVVCHAVATIAGQIVDGLSVHLHHIVDTFIVESWFLDERPIEEDAAFKAAFELMTARA